MLKHKFSLITLFFLLLNVISTESFSIRCASGIVVTPATTQTLCAGTPAAQLMANSTLSGSGVPGSVTYTWYSNTVNSTVGGTVVKGPTARSANQNDPYTPLTTTPGTLYYYSVVTNVGTCGTASFISATVQVTVNAPNAPTGTDGSRCGTGTVSLSATPGAGETIDWFAAATGGTALLTGSTAFTTPSITSTITYYAQARNTITGCISTTRTAVIATVFALPVAPAGTGAVTCGSASVSVSATPGVGETIDWYAASSGGTALVTGSTTYNTPVISTTTVYYAEARNLSCGGVSPSRTAVSATVNPLPTLSGVSQVVPVCSGFTATITLSGLLPGTAQTISYNINGGGTQTTSITSSAGGSGSFAVAVTSANNGQPVTVTGITINATGCTLLFGSNNSVALQVNASPSVTSQPSTLIQSVCRNAVPIPISVSAVAGSGSIITYQWYSNPANSTIGGTLVATNTTSATSNAYSPVTSAAGTLYYYVIITNSNTCTVTSNVSGPVVVSNGSVPTVTAQPSTASQEVCLSALPTTLSITASGSSLAYQWYSSPNSNGSSATLINGATATTYTPLTTAAGTLYYYCQVSSNSCSVTSNVSGAITVDPPSVGGTISGAATVCTGTNSTLLTLSGNTGTIQWQSSPDNIAFTNLAGQTTATYSAINLITTTYYRALVTSGMCASIGSSSVAVSVSPASVAGSISGATTVCAGTNTTVLTLSGQTGAIQWQSSSDNTTFNNLVGETSATHTATNLAATTYYRAVVTSGTCAPDASASVTMTVSTASVAGSISGATTVCAGTNTTVLTLSGQTGAIQWQSSGDNTTFNDLVGETSTTYTAINLVASTYYRAVVTNSPCGAAASASVFMDVNTSNSAGTIAGAATVCPGVNNTVLTLSGNVGTIQWQSSSDNTTFNDLVGETSTTYTAVNLAATTYYRVIVTGPCAVVTSVSQGIAVLTPGSNLWTGNVNSDWSNPANWTCGVPDQSLDVTIPSGVTNYPVLGPIVAEVKDLNISNGASLTFSPGTLLIIVGNWTNNNLTSTSVVTDYSEVYFTGAGTHTISGTSNFYYITIDDSNGAITLNINGPTGVGGVLGLTTNATVNTNDQVTLLSTGNTTDLDASIGPIPSGAVFNGQVTVNRYMHAFGYSANRYIAMPVAAQTATTAFSDDFQVASGSVRFYDETVAGVLSNGYTTQPLASTLQQGVGYLAWMYDGVNEVTWDAMGTIYQGSIGLPVTYTPTSGGINADGWNLVGNPYPSSINWSNDPNDWTRSADISPVVYVTDMQSNQFIPFNYTDNTGEGGVIAMGQAFWVKTSAANPSLTIHEPAKATNAFGRFYRKAETTSSEQLIVTLQQGQLRDKAYLKINEQATSDFDHDYDGYKLMNGALNIYLRDEAQRNLVMHTLKTMPQDLRISLVVEGKVPGEYEISFANTEQFSVSGSLYLIDAWEGVAHPVTSGDPYRVQFSQADLSKPITDRFYLSQNPTLQERHLADWVQAYPNPVKDKLTVRMPKHQQANVTLLDVQGHTLWIQNLHGEGTIDFTSYPSGLFLLKIVSATEVTTLKILK